MSGQVSPVTATGGTASLIPEPARAERQAAVQGFELTKRYGEGAAAVDALRGVTVDFAAGSFSSIMGPSGSGKSTLLHILAGLERPTGGWVEIGGIRLGGMSDHDLTLLRRRSVGFIFQSYNLLPVLTAEENILLPVGIAGEQPDIEWLETLLSAMRIGHRRSHRPGEMSGGEQQRVAVARALMTRPTVVFADEPTGNLDSVAGREILALLRRAVDEFGQTIVMVTHDPAAAAGADRTLFLADGEVRDDAEGLPPTRSSTALSRCDEEAAVRSLAARKLRTVLSAVAVVLGVAMVSGSYIETDQIRNAFEGITEQSVEGIDVVVSPAEEFTPAFSSQLPTIPDAHGRGGSSGCRRRRRTPRASSARSEASWSTASPSTRWAPPPWSARTRRMHSIRRRPWPGGIPGAPGRSRSSSRTQSTTGSSWATRSAS